MITIDEITIVRDGREIIYDYSEQIPAGSITVIIGPNGCGKSTLLAAIAGDIAPDKGTITIDDVHPILTPASSLAAIRAMAVQNQSFTLGFTDDHGDWKYETVIAQAAAGLVAHEVNDESHEVRWVDIEKVDELPLHPSFAKTCRTWNHCCSCGTQH